MPDKRYFLPKALRENLSKPGEVRFKRATLGTTDNFKVPGFALTGERRTLKSFLKKNQLCEEDWGVCDGQVHTILRADQPPTISPLVESSQTIRKALMETPDVLKDFERVLGTFMRRIGRRVQLHLVDGPSFPPYAKNTPDLHLVVGASPPGTADTLERLTLCGILMNPRGAYVQSRGPALGYGIVVRDEEKAVTSQIVGNTFYLFVPTPENANRVLFFGSQGIELFTRVLALTWNTYTSGAREPTPTPIQSFSEYSKLITEGGSIYSSVQRDLLETIDKEAQDLLVRYREKLNMKRILLAAEKAYQDIAAANSDHAKGWKVLSKHPLITQMGAMDGVLFFETNWIIQEFQGKKYKLGRYMIRKPVGAPSSIWAVETAHPRRVPHPHISAHGVVCYGNATAGIEEANTEMRVADELELLLRWLSEGYSPDLAMARIEQWPTVE